MLSLTGTCRLSLIRTELSLIGTELSLIGFHRVKDKFATPDQTSCDPKQQLNQAKNEMGKFVQKWKVILSYGPFEGCPPKCSRPPFPACNVDLWIINYCWVCVENPYFEQFLTSQIGIWKSLFETGNPYLEPEIPIWNQTSLFGTKNPYSEPRNPYLEPEILIWNRK